MSNILDYFKPRCPNCDNVVPIVFRQFFKCRSCGAVLEDDRIYNMKLYFLFIFFVLVSVLLLPVYLVIPLFFALVWIVVRNMRFIVRAS